MPYYAVEQEMYLRMQGIKPNAMADSSSLAKMRLLGYNFFVRVNVGSTESGMGYNSVSAAEQRELQTGYGTQQADETKASVNFELYSMGSIQPIYTLSATTSMKGVTFPSGETENGYRGSRTINASTTPLAIDKAFNKGLTKILKECQ